MDVEVLLTSAVNTLTCLGCYYIFLRIFPRSHNPSFWHQLATGALFFLSILLNKYLSLVFEVGYVRNELVVISGFLGGPLSGFTTYVLTAGLRYFMQVEMNVDSFLPGFIEITMFYLLGLGIWAVFRKRLHCLKWYEISLLIPAIHVVFSIADIHLLHFTGLLEPADFEFFVGVRTNPVTFPRAMLIFTLIYMGLQWEFRRVLLEHQNQEKNAELISEVDQRQRAEKELKNLVNKDALTNLHNRRGLSHYLNAKVMLTEQAFALVFLDLDDFKNLNDYHGHKFGDQVLISVGRALENFSRQHEISEMQTFRFGGDEFVICITEKDNISIEAERYVQLLRKYLLTEMENRFQLALTFSAGVALYPEHGNEVDELIRKADLSMYHTKHIKKASQCFFNPEVEQISNRNYLIIKDFSTALERGDVHMCYQPLYDAAGKNIVSFEALIRWSHPQLGRISPAVFVPVLENTALVKLISLWTFREVIRFQQQCHAQGLAVDLSWNLSPCLFDHPEILGEILIILNDESPDPGGIIIEITENYMVNDRGQAEFFIKHLKRRGCQIVMDDFGAGFSSLAELTRTLLDGIKVDKSLLPVDISARDKLLVNSIISLAAGLELNITVEGVETEQQFNWLKQTGCDKFQGFYFQQPLAEEGALKLLAENRSGQLSHIQQADCPV